VSNGDATNDKKKKKKKKKEESDGGGAAAKAEEANGSVEMADADEIVENQVPENRKIGDQRRVFLKKG
jgi:hypothetical protein